MQDKKLAVLIDADNANANIIEPLLAEIAKYGIASVKRIYGDWSSGLNKWKEALLPHAIIPIQQFAYTKGKNATDMALVIDAMDLLYSETFDGFCIVSSDSDFTRLASRLRESGLRVYGFGEKKTPEAFRRACDIFIFTENLISEPEKSDIDSMGTLSTGNPIQGLPQVEMLINRAIKETADENGWAELGAVGNYIRKTSPDFDQRSYGFAKLADLIRSLQLFELKQRNNSNSFFVRRQSYRRFIRIVQNIINQHADSDGKIELAKLCSRIKQADSDFNPETFGHSTVSKAIRTIHTGWVELFEIEGKTFAKNIKIMQ